MRVGWRCLNLSIKNTRREAMEGRRERGFYLPEGTPRALRRERHRQEGRSRPEVEGGRGVSKVAGILQ